jgi:O-phosphoseryl-tRNA(Sec) kinase
MIGITSMKEKLYETPNKKTFTMLIGLPGTGKTTFAKKILKQNAQDRILVSSDNIRFDLLNYEETGIDFDPKIEPKVWARVIKEIKKALDNSTVKEVIFDATNLIKSGRKPYLELAKDKGFHTRGIVFSAPLSEIKARNRNRKRKVPEEVIDRFYRSFEYPEKGEFDEIIEIEF